MAGTAMETYKEKLAQLARRAVAQVNTAKGGAAKISFRGGVMKFKDQPIAGNKIACIIVAHAFENSYYGTSAFDPDNPQNPLCFALGLDDAMALHPHPDGEEIQNDGPCATCKWFQWGTATRNGKPAKGRACKQSIRLLIIAENDTETDEDLAKAQIVLANIPTTSRDHYVNYVNSLATDYNSSPIGVVTEISCAAHTDNNFELSFKPLGTVDEESFLEGIFKRQEEGERLALKPYEKQTDAPAEVAKPAKAQRGRR